jgi:hypothetical protein
MDMYMYIDYSISSTTTTTTNTFLVTRLTPTGPSIIEFNCRFGDPETQVVLPLLETDLYEVMTACCDGNLDSVDIRFKENMCAATVVGAAKGYPEKYPKGMEITGLSDADAIEGVKVYHAGTKLDENLTSRCSGGRVIAVTGTGPTLSDALGSSYNALGKLDFVGDNAESLMHFRTDIAKGAMGKNYVLEYLVLLVERHLFQLLKHVLLVRYMLRLLLLLVIRKMPLSLRRGEHLVLLLLLNLFLRRAYHVTNTMRNVHPSWKELVPNLLSLLVICVYYLNNFANIGLEDVLMSIHLYYPNMLEAWILL